MKGIAAGMQNTVSKGEGVCFERIVKKGWARSSLWPAAHNQPRWFLCAGLRGCGAAWWPPPPGPSFHFVAGLLVQGAALGHWLHNHPFD